MIMQLKIESQCMYTGNLTLAFPNISVLDFMTCQGRGSVTQLYLPLVGAPFVVNTKRGTYHHKAVLSLKMNAEGR